MRLSPFFRGLSFLTHRGDLSFLTHRGGLSFLTHRGGLSFLAHRGRSFFSCAQGKIRVSLAFLFFECKITKGMLQAI